MSVSLGYRHVKNAVLQPTRPAELVRLLFGAGLVCALVIALAAGASGFDAKKECRGGAFSSAFNSGFDVRRCDFVVRMISSDAEIVRLPMLR